MCDYRKIFEKFNEREGFISWTQILISYGSYAFACTNFNEICTECVAILILDGRERYLMNPNFEFIWELFEQCCLKPT